MSFVDRLDRFQRRHPVLGFPIAVIYKFFDDQGPYLTALITYYGFLSAFPILLLLSSVLGFVLQGNPDLEKRIIEATLSQFPVIGVPLQAGQLAGDWRAIAIGGVVALYGSLGIAQAIQNAMNISWAVPRNLRPNPVLARVRSMAMVATSGLLVLITTVLSGIDTNTYLPALGSYGGYVATALGIALNALVFMLVYRISTAHRMRRREIAPGAIFAAIWWQVVQAIGVTFVNAQVRGMQATYGFFAIVLALMAWAYLAALGLVLSVEINVVRAKHLYPRALLTIFTDNVELTEADKWHYQDMVNANRLKGFQQVEVSFERKLSDLADEAARAEATTGAPGPGPSGGGASDEGGSTSGHEPRKS